MTLAYLNNYTKGPNVLVNGVAEYTDAVRTTLDQNQATGRGDWLPNANSSVFARYTYTKQDFQGNLFRIPLH